MAAEIAERGEGHNLGSGPVAGQDTARDFNPDGVGYR